MKSLTEEVKASAHTADSTHRTEYLGDGLYAGLDGDMVVLSCDREDGEHIIFLDFEVFMNLLRFANKVGFRV